MRVAGVDASPQPADSDISSGSASPGPSSALSRQPYDSCDESERADHELWLLFVNRFDIAFRPRDEGPRDGAHCPAAVQPLSLWRLLQGLARRANAGAASLQLKHHTSHLALCKWQRYGPCGSTKPFQVGQLSDTRTTHKRAREPSGGQTPHTEASDAVEASMLSSTTSDAARGRARRRRLLPTAFATPPGPARPVFRAICFFASVLEAASYRGRATKAQTDGPRGPHNIAAP